MSASLAPIVDDTRARRNAGIFSVAQALFGASTTVLVTVGGLVGYALASDKALATIPITAYVLGTAVTTIPAAILMRKVGRRAGFICGAVLGAVGAGLAAYALWVSSFILFCTASALIGSYQGFAGYYRYAAADTASDSFKAKAVSWVLVGGVASALIGPLVVIWASDLIASVQYAGAFLSIMALTVLAVGVLSFIDIPHVDEKIATQGARPLREILAQPKLLIAIFCCMVAYAIMILVMTSTPLAMVASKHSVDDAAIVIQWHIVAMYAPSFFTGYLIERFGKERIVAIGMAVLIVSGIVALLGSDLMNFWLALVFLGIGWNFGFIGGTTLVLECYRSSEVNKVQAASDFSVFATVGVASFASGIILNSFGWEAVQYAVFPLVVVALVLVLFVKRPVKPELLL